MKKYADQLLALLTQIPRSIAEEELPQLGEAATSFQHLVQLVLHHEEGAQINKLYYYQRLKDIETELYEAKYGRDQKQRDTAFKKAKRELAAGIEDLLGFINDHTSPSAN